MGSSDYVKSIDCSPEQVNLLIGISHYQPCGVLMLEYVQHGGVHVLAFINQKNLVIKEGWRKRIEKN